MFDIFEWNSFVWGNVSAQGMNFRATWLELALARSWSGSWIMEKTLTATDVTSSILHHMNPSIHLQPTNLLLHLSNTTSASPVSLFFVSSIVSRGFKGFCSSVHLPADSSSSSSSPWWLLHNVVLSLRFKKKKRTLGRTWCGLKLGGRGCGGRFTVRLEVSWGSNAWTNGLHW